jgi:hypothetical protein
MTGKSRRLSLAGARKIEITEEMIRAGREVLYRSGRLQYEVLGADHLLIRSSAERSSEFWQAIRERP